MEIFDGAGNFLGEFIEDQKDDVVDSDGIEIFLKLIFKAIPLIILASILWVIIKIGSFFIKWACKILWWLLRLPFCLIFNKKWPKF